MATAQFVKIAKLKSKTSQKKDDTNGCISIPSKNQSHLENSIQKSSFVSSLQKKTDDMIPDFTSDTEAVQGKFTVQMDELEEEIQPKMAIQRQELDEEMMQPKMAAQKSETAESSSAGSSGLDRAISNMEGVLNTDFSDVSINPSSEKATEVGALAYTQGNEINFAPGQFSPDSSSGQQLLGHELTHVVQQREGRVQPTGEIAGLPVNDNVSLEKEADVLGRKASGL